MKLDDGTRSTVERGERSITSGTHEAINARFAVTHDRARGMTRCRLNSVLEPLPIACCNQHFGVNAFERFGVSIFDFRNVSHALHKPGPEGIFVLGWLW